MHSSAPEMARDEKAPITKVKRRYGQGIYLWPTAPRPQLHPDTRSVTFSTLTPTGPRHKSGRSDNSASRWSAFVRWQFDHPPSTTGFCSRRSSSEGNLGEAILQGKAGIPLQRCRTDNKTGPCFGNAYPLRSGDQNREDMVEQGRRT